MSTSDFNHVFLQYRNMMMNVAYDVLKDYHLSQDVCQDVFFKLTVLSPEQLTISNKTKNLLAVVTFNKAIDYYRRRNRLAEVSFDEVSETKTELEINEMLDQRNVLSKVFRDLRDNHPDWYDVIIRICFFEEDGKTAARKLGINVRTLRTRYFRARKYIYKEYGKDFFESIL